MTINRTVFVIALAAVFAAPATAAKRPAPWTAAKATAQVKANVRIPYCRFYNTNGPNCADGKPVSEKAKAQPPIAIRNARVTCAPSVAVLFDCTWEAPNDIGSGQIRVYVAGPATFRWKSL